MAKFSSAKRLMQEDYTEQPWIGKLLSILNDFMSKMVSSMSNDLTFQDNLKAQINTLDVKVLTANTYPIAFKTKINAKPIGLWVINAQEIAANPAVLTSPVFADWSYNNGQISINNISGLTVGNRYNISVAVIYG